MTLMEKIQEYEGLLDKAVPEFKKRGLEKAEAEKKYRIALAKEFLMLRDQGEKVTIMSDLARGKEEIAELKFQRDVAETLYESAKEAIMIYKKQIDTLMTIYKAEWGQSKQQPKLSRHPNETIRKGKP